MDDLNFVVPYDGVKIVSNTINTLDPHIKFTLEYENKRRVPFLDTKVVRDNNILNLGRYIGFRGSG